MDLHANAALSLKGAAFSCAAGCGAGLVAPGDLSNARHFSFQQSQAGQGEHEH
jgi:hypothetical protein